jgi:putative ABC transport system permease protein
MRQLRAWFIRLGGLFHKERRDRELAEELESHLQMHIEDNLRSGMTPEEARRQAHIKLGGLEQTEESYRDRRSLPALETVIQDLRYGLRMLAKNPGFTAVAVLTLALGIGANTAIFSVVNAVLLRPLPYMDPDRLVQISENNPKYGTLWFAVAPANFLDWQQQNHVFESMAIFGVWSEEFYLAGVGQPEQLQGRYVSASFFPLLGVQPILGRTFLPEEDRPGQRVVVLTYAFWQRRFGSDAKALGRQITLNGESYTVIGVMPKGFQVLAGGYSEEEREHLWLPNPFENFAPTEREVKGLEAIARLKPGVSLVQAQAEMDTIAHRLEQAYPKTNDGWGVNVRPLFDEVTQSEYGTKFRPALLLLMGAVGLVLLIACVNVASLLLARSVARQRELAVRTALGASRARLIRQLLTESVLLTTLGGALGVLLAVGSVPVLVALSPAGIPRLDEAGVDGTALGFALLVSLVTGVLCGLVPALQSSRPDLNEALKEGSRGATGGLAQQRTHRLLVVAEIALALVLLTGAGLMINSFLRLQKEDLGFDPKNVLTAQLSLPRSKYADVTKPAANAPRATANSKWWTVRPNVSAFVRQVVERLEHLPGVRSAAAVNFPPLGVAWGNIFGIEGVSPLPRDPQGWKQGPGALYRAIDGDYFQTMRIRLIQGRDFTTQECETGAGVAIINQTMARHFFPDGDALGRRLSLSDSYVEEDKERLLEIVGVVADVKEGWPWTESWKDAKYTIYMPFDQQGRTFVDWQIWFRLHVSFVVRTASNPARLSAAVRKAIWEVDSDQPIQKLTTMKEFVSEMDSQRRFYLLILGILAGVALVLASVGIYGVMSYSVSQRTHEIGVRRALGAGRREILIPLLTQGALLSLLGVGLGLAGALSLTGFLSSFLYGVGATDAATFAGVALLLMAVALLACYFPARRAMKVDPMVALRYE